jgi:trimethylamine--corrinoid protein Co-methyltransferase
MKFVESEHFLPRMSDRRTRDAWARAGSKSMADAAHERVEQILAEHTVKALDPSVEEELVRIVREVEQREARRQ